jgi:hypothetical protein
VRQEINSLRQKLKESKNRFNKQRKVLLKERGVKCIKCFERGV